MNTKILPNKTTGLHTHKGWRLSDVFRWKIWMMLACLLWAGNLSAETINSFAVGQASNKTGIISTPERVNDDVYHFTITGTSSGNDGFDITINGTAITTASTCPDGTAIPNYFKWAFTDFVFGSNLSDGEVYQIYVKYMGGNTVCFSSTPFCSALNRLSGSTSYNICVDGTITLPTYEQEGTWKEGTATISTATYTGTSAGVKTLTFTPDDPDYCPADITVNVNADPTLSLSDASLCVGSAATLLISGGVAGGESYSFSSSPASGVVTVSGNSVNATGAGTATFTVTQSAPGCTSTSLPSLTVDVSPVISPANPAVMIGGSLQLSPANGWTVKTENGISITAGGLVSIAAGTAPNSKTTFTNTTGACSATTTVTAISDPCSASGITLTAVSGISSITCLKEAGVCDRNIWKITPTAGANKLFTISGLNNTRQPQGMGSYLSNPNYGLNDCGYNCATEFFVEVNSNQDVIFMTDNPCSTSLSPVTDCPAAFSICPGEVSVKAITIKGTNVPIAGNDVRVSLSSNEAFVFCDGDGSNERNETYLSGTEVNDPAGAKVYIRLKAEAVAGSYTGVTLTAQIGSGGAGGTYTGSSQTCTNISGTVKAISATPSVQGASFCDTQSLANISEACITDAEKNNITWWYAAGDQAGSEVTGSLPAGNYSLYATRTGEGECKSANSAGITVDIYEVPVITLTSGAQNAVVCENGSVSIQYTCGGGATGATIEFKDGAAIVDPSSCGLNIEKEGNSITVSGIPTKSLTYTVTAAIAAGSPCPVATPDATKEGSITVHPRADLSASVAEGDSVICLNEDITLASPALDGTWSVANGNALTVNGNTATGSSVGFADLVFTTSTGSCTSTITGIEVKPLPANNPVITSNNYSITDGKIEDCGDISTTLTAANAAAGETYTWNSGTAVIDNNNSPSQPVSVAQGHSETYTVYITSASGCESAPAQVTLNAKLTSAIPGVPATELVCYDSKVEVLTLTERVEGSAIDWYKGEEKTPVQSSDVLENATYFAIQTETGKCRSEYSSGVVVTVSSQLTAGAITPQTIDYNTSVTLNSVPGTGTPEGGTPPYQYQWKSSTSENEQNWDTITPVAGGESFTSDHLTQDTWFIRGVKNGDNTCGDWIYTAPVKVTVTQREILPLPESLTFAPTCIYVKPAAQSTTVTTVSLNAAITVRGDFEFAVTDESETTEPESGWYSSTGATPEELIPGVKKVWVRPTAATAGNPVEGAIVFTDVNDELFTEEVALTAVVNGPEIGFYLNNETPVNEIQFENSGQEARYVDIIGACLTGESVTLTLNQNEVNGYTIGLGNVDFVNATAGPIQLPVKQGQVDTLITVWFDGTKGSASTGTLTFDGGGLSAPLPLSLSGNPPSPVLIVSQDSIIGLKYSKSSSSYSGPDCGAGMAHRILVTGRNLKSDTELTLTGTNFEVAVGGVTEPADDQYNPTITIDESVFSSAPYNRLFVWVKMTGEGDYNTAYTDTLFFNNTTDNLKDTVVLKGLVQYCVAPCKSDTLDVAYTMTRDGRTLLPTPSGTGFQSVSSGDYIITNPGTGKTVFAYPPATVYIEDLQDGSTLTLDGGGKIYVKSDSSVILNVVQTHGGTLILDGQGPFELIDGASGSFGFLFINKGTTVNVKTQDLHNSNTGQTWKTSDNVKIYNRGIVNVIGNGFSPSVYNGSPDVTPNFGNFYFNGSTFLNMGEMYIDGDFKPLNAPSSLFVNNGLIQVKGNIVYTSGNVCLEKGACFNVELDYFANGSTSMTGSGGIHFNGNARTDDLDHFPSLQVAEGQAVNISCSKESKVQLTSSSTAASSDINSLANWGVTVLIDTIGSGCANCYVLPVQSIYADCAGERNEIVMEQGASFYEWEVPEGAILDYDLMSDGSIIDNRIFVTFPPESNGTYTVTAHYDYENNQCTQDIEISVKASVPLLWAGADDLWGVSTNWKLANVGTNKRDIDSVTAAAPNTAGIIATKCTDVYLQYNAPGMTGYPTLQPGDAARDIYFGVNTSVGKIHNLEYEKAYVDMAIPKWNILASNADANWHMITAPLKNLKSGSYAYVRADVSTFLRYFAVTAETSTTFKGDWTKTVALTGINDGERLGTGMGYAFRYATLNEDHVFKFPREDNGALPDSSYHLIAGGADGRVRETFSVTYVLDGRDGSAKVDIGESMNEASGYLIVGNPFMSHLDMDSFYNANKDIIYKDIKRFDAKSSEFGFMLSDTETFSQEFGKYIPPMQSFFVKLKGHNSGTVELEFDSESMSRTSTTQKLKGQEAFGNRLSLQVALGARTSLTSIVKANSGASNEFYVEEDAQKLFSGDAPLQVYTLAGTVPSEVNVINADSLSELIIPVGIRNKTAGKVTLSISGISGFTSADNIWLVDSKEGTRTSLFDSENFEFDLAAGTSEDRFYLYFEQAPREEPPGGTTGVTDAGAVSDAVYMNTNGNMLNVLSKGEPVEEITIYDLTSRIVYHARINTNYFSYRLPNVQEVYLVKAVTGKQTVTGKVIVK
ncbi:MAG: T9SS type A sorting domain-containing protein [Prevotellaceae bacterium]|jgi:hypothetical protein|nr:T9SS type A sorting domain-containing protein [Prevotellaceae bacterium]